MIAEAPGPSLTAKGSEKARLSIRGDLVIKVLRDLPWYVDPANERIL